MDSELLNQRLVDNLHVNLLNYPQFPASPPPVHFMAIEHLTKEKYKFIKSLLLNVSVLRITAIYCVTNICTADNNIISILTIKSLTSFFCLISKHCILCNLASFISLLTFLEAPTLGVKVEHLRHCPLQSAFLPH